jgi:exopolysaccharide biosynthesis WecB/TagA/CpsF family protein
VETSKSQFSCEFYDIYQNADWIICDSKIIALGLKYLGTPIKEAIPGSSLFPAFCDFHKTNPSIRIFLLGAKEGVANKAKEKINKRIGRKIIVGAHSPSFGFEKDEEECLQIVDKINQSDATVLLVGVGSPKQEKWIFKYKDKLPAINLFLPLGATIDFEAGHIKRAPEIFQKLALEWLYRMIREPKRLIKRYLIDDIPFFYYLFKQRMGCYKNPF